MPFESLIETKNSTSCDLGFPGSLFFAQTPHWGVCCCRKRKLPINKKRTRTFLVKNRVRVRTVCGELGTRTPDPLRVMHETFRFLERQFVKYARFATDLLQTAVFRLASVTCFLYSHWPNFQLLYSPLAKKVSNVLCGLMIVFSVDV